MKSILFKCMATTITIPLLILANAAVMEAYSPAQTRYQPDGFFLLLLMVPALIAIWARHGTFMGRIGAGIVGTICFAGAVVILYPFARLVSRSITYSDEMVFSSSPSLAFLLLWSVSLVVPQIPKLAGLIVGSLATWAFLRSRIAQLSAVGEI